MSKARTQKTQLSRRSLVQGGVGVTAGLAASTFAVPNVIRARQDQTVSFMNWDTVKDTPLETVLNAFQEQTGITVEVQPTPAEDYETKFRTLLASGAPPDVMRINDNLVRGIAEQDQLTDLGPYLAESSVPRENYNESILSFARTPSDTLPAWVIGSRPRVIFYNATMFEEAGVALPPTTWTSEGWMWEDFLKTAQQLTVEGERWGALIYLDTGYEQTWLVNNGVEPGIYSEDGTEFTMATPEGIEAVQWATDLACEHGVQPPWSELQQDDAGIQLFAAGDLGMFYAGMDAIPYLHQNAGDFVWDVAPVPAKVKQTTESSLIVYCIPRDAQNPDVAWELLEFLGGPEAGQIFAEAGNFIPLWKDASQYIQAGDQPPANMGIFGEAAAHNTFVSPAATEQGRARLIYRQQLELVYTCQKSAEEVLTSVKDEVEAVLAEGS